ncbi:PREDICTED: probable galacturonosyltransferase 10 isoform X2 [Lupinus angustifolius]|uniref:probable galacturonosyltransferase 10 isoform X1 n=1 Tax=Lupinus angustifolius TaxID=3871 RepID=UPI00092EEA07|nr:PREDICTED: probable galacturonosyltransferase 10 isoform X1 [Lupinus angustifolius]XP_019417170.1 PREDICTED: probable galacturonosyltransferase 10 isoform X2 [Lupinus angustifolius]XP_019417171.1 PREDICTED: probable galacturonosyltransferase 10 isoform X2 [Lupinus angustifolius]
MRRRAVDFRRPLRRKVRDLLWWALCCAVIILFLYILTKGNQIESITALSKRTYKNERIVEGLNMTEEMLNPNSVTRQVNDQISLAKAFVVIAKESKNLQFAWELSAQIRNSQILLSNAATRRSPLTTIESENAIHDMALLLYQSQQLHYDSATMLMRFKAKIQALEEQMNSVSEKSSKYGQIAAEEVPKSLYCLGVRLTTEWFKNHNIQNKLKDKRQVEMKLKDNNLYHFCIFSDNILATSVVVNSTAINSKNPDTIVFHLVTDEINYAAMKAWFAMNDFRGVTVEVQKFEDFTWLNASYAPVLKQLQDSEVQNYYFSGNSDNGRTPIKFRNPKYLSMLNHLRFYIPEVFPALKKVVFLDDDVVVQKDLSALFSIDLNGNVNGAVETCMETFHRYHKYLNYSHPLIRPHFDPDACGWAFGMNVFDLVQWRKKNVTGIYHYWQEKNIDRTLWKLGTLPPGLLTFYGLTEPLDPSWHVLGFGYTNVDPQLIERGAVLHFNGNSKPWLKIGIEKYKPLWEKYVEYSHPLLQQCNFH